MSASVSIRTCECVCVWGGGGGGGGDAREVIYEQEETPTTAERDYGHTHSD